MALQRLCLGQNVNSYGKTLKDPVTLHSFSEKVEQIEGLKRIWFMTSHPKDLSDELIEYMSKSRKVCHHLHLPMQFWQQPYPEDHEPAL